MGICVSEDSPSGILRSGIIDNVGIKPVSRVGEIDLS